MLYGATNLKVGAQCIVWWGVNRVKTQKFEKGGECMTPSSYGGATPALTYAWTLSSGVPDVPFGTGSAIKPSSHTNPTIYHHSSSSH